MSSHPTPSHAPRFEQTRARYHSHRTRFAPPHRSVPLVAHSVYTRLLVASSCVSGLYFGFVFGKMGAGDANTTSIELALKQYNYYYYPVGCLLGGALAFVNRFLTLPERHSTPEDKYMDDQDGL